MSPRVLLRKAWIWGPLLAYLALIYYFSSLSRIAWAEAYPDYVEHAAEYFGLALLTARAFNNGVLRRIPPGVLILAFFACVAYAISDELHQMFVPDRFADYRDVLSDACGAGIALLLTHYGARLWARGSAA